MQGLWLLPGAVILLCLLVLLISYLCYRITFFVPRRKDTAPQEFKLPRGKAFRAFRQSMEAWAKETRSMPCEEMEIVSFDGLTLRGKYYEFAPGAPIELMFHGYRGSAERDLCGGVQRCFQLGRSALLVDQRCSGGSQGKAVTFGICESRDCLSWVDFMCGRFGPDVKILLCGISMGAATVLMAAGNPLPDNVIGVLADCGYSSARDIIRKVIRQLKLPAGLLYPFVKLGARLYGRFDLEAFSPVEAMKKCTVPVIFFHGEQDDFVPCEMSRINYDACAARKKLVTIPGAGHGLSYLVDPQTYMDSLREFFGPEASHPAQRSRE